jgi:hypothetical protein
MMVNDDRNKISSDGFQLDFRPSSVSTENCSANCSNPFCWSDLLGIVLVTVRENFEDGLTMMKHQEQT